MARIVRVWIGNDYIDYEIDEIPAECTEDELYERCRISFIPIFLYLFESIF